MPKHRFSLLLGAALRDTGITVQLAVLKPFPGSSFKLQRLNVKLQWLALHPALELWVRSLSTCVLYRGDILTSMTLV